MVLPEVLEPGECFTDVATDDEAVTEMVVVACGPGVHEVLAVVEAPGAGGGFPGEDEVLLAADEACSEVFEAAPPEVRAGGVLGHVAPTGPMWDAGERRVVCVVTPHRD